MEWGTSDTISTFALLASVGSAIYAYKTYRATVDLKKHDFTLQLQTSNETLRATVGGLESLLAKANRSRRALMAARGLLGGSVSNEWSNRVTELTAEMEALKLRLPVEHVVATSLDVLRAQIVETHGYQVRATAAQAELNEALEQDVRELADYRQDRRASRPPPPPI